MTDNLLTIGSFWTPTASFWDKKLEIEQRSSKETKKSLIFGSKFGFRVPFMMGKIPHKIFPLKCGFGIGYGYWISQKYCPMWVSVSVSDLNQNSGFVGTLIWTWKFQKPKGQHAVTIWTFTFHKKTGSV